MLLRKRLYSELDSYGGSGDVMYAGGNGDVNYAGGNGDVMYADAGQMQYAAVVCSVALLRYYVWSVLITFIGHVWWFGGVEISAQFSDIFHRNIYQIYRRPPVLRHWWRSGQRLNAI